MVYFLIEREPFETATGTSIIDGDYDSVARVSWENPEEVDAVSKIREEPMTSGYRVVPATVPKKVRWESKSRIPPDVIKCRGVLVVSPMFREIVERFEPGTHQFLPVNLYRPKEEQPFCTHFWLVVGTRIDSGDNEHSTYERSRNGTGVWRLGEPNKKLIFNRAAIGVRHMWLDPYLGTTPLCSNQLGDALSAANITGMRLKGYEEA